MTAVDPSPPVKRLASFRCERCGYGARTKELPPRCPMCGGVFTVVTAKKR